MKYKTHVVILTLSFSLSLVSCSIRPKSNLTSTSTQTEAGPPVAVPGDQAVAERQRGYLGRYNNGVVFVQLVDNNGRLEGQLQIAHIDNRATVSSQNYPFTGSRSGKDVSITLSGSVWTTGWNSKTLTGTLSENALTLVTPNSSGTLDTMALNASTVEEYNKSVTEIHQSAVQQLQAQQAVEATAKAAQDAADERAWRQKAVVSANSAVAAALLTLTTDRDQLAYDPRFDGVMDTEKQILDQMKQQFIAIQQRANRKLTCYERSQLDYEVGQIDYDLGQIDYQRGQADYIKSHMTDRIRSVNDDIQDLQRAWAKLQVATSTNTTGTPAPSYTTTDIEKAIKTANDKINTTSSTMQTTLAKVDEFYNHGNALLAEARNFMTKVKCTD